MREGATTLRRSHATSSLSRRRFLAWGAAPVFGIVASWRRSAGGSVQDSIPAGGPSGRLFDPNRAGRPQPPTDARDSDPAVRDLEKRLRCTCGCNLDVYTCRTTDFTCTTSPAMHREVLALLDEGKSADEVVQAFVERHGQAILMAPPKRGFNLAGYFVPGLSVLAAAVVLLVVLRRWTRGAAATAATPPVPTDASPEELARLRRELEDFPA